MDKEIQKPKKKLTKESDIIDKLTTSLDEGYPTPKMNKKKKEQADYFKKEQARLKLVQQQQKDKIKQSYPKLDYDLNYTNASESTKLVNTAPVVDLTKPKYVKKFNEGGQAGVDFIETEMDDEAIAYYKKLGYEIEEIE